MNDVLIRHGFNNLFAEPDWSEKETSSKSWIMGKRRAWGSKHPQCRDPTRANENGYPWLLRMIMNIYLINFSWNSSWSILSWAVIFNKQTRRTISSITNATCSIQSFILHCTPRNLSFLSHHLAYSSYTLVIMTLVWKSMLEFVMGKSSNNKGSRLYYLLEALHEWGMLM